MAELAIVINARNQAGPALTSLNQQLGAVERQVSTMKESLASAGQSMQKAGTMASFGVTLPLVGIGMAAIKTASDLSESTNKIDVLFGNSAAAMMKWSQSSALSLGQTRVQALDAASTFGIFGQSAGLASEDLMKFSTDFTGLASDLASFHNTSPEEAIQAIGAAMRGETEPIRRYGVLLDDATMRQKALEMGLVATTKDALSPQNKVLAASALLWDQTKSAQGDFAKTSTGLANAQRILTAQMSELALVVGERLLPYAQKLVAWALDATKAFTSLSPAMQDFLVIGGVIAAAAGPALVILGTLVTGIAALISPIGLVIAAVAALAAAFATDFMGIRSAVMPLVNLLTDRFGSVFKELSSGSNSISDVFGDVGSLFGGVGDGAAGSTEHLFGFIEALTGSTTAAGKFVSFIASVGGSFQLFIGHLNAVSAAVQKFGASSTWTGLTGTISSALSSISGQFAKLFTGEITLQAFTANVGEQLRNVSQTLVDAVKSEDFGRFSQELLDAIGLGDFDFGAFLEQLSKFASDIASAISTFDYGSAIADMGNSIVSAFQVIDWGGIGNALLGLGTAVVNAIRGIDWGGALNTAGDFLAGLVGSVVTKVKGIDWGLALSTVIGFTDGIRIWAFDQIKGINWALPAEGIFDALSAAVGLAVSGITWLVDNLSFENLRTTVLGAIETIDWAGISDSLAALQESIKTQIEGIDWSALTDKIAEMQNTLSSQQVTLTFSTTTEGDSDNIGVMVSKIGEAEGAVDKFSAAWRALEGVFGPALSRLGTSLGELVTEFGNLFSQFSILQTIGAVLLSVLLGAIDLISAAFRSLGNVLWVLFSEVSTVFSSLWGVITGFVEMVSGILTGQWAQAWGGAGKIVTSIAGFIGSTIANLSALFLWFGVLLGEFISTILSDTGFTSIANQVQGVVDKIKEAAVWLQNFAAGKADVKITLPKFEWPKLPTFEWPKLPIIEMPKFPTLEWPKMPMFEWPKLPTFDWPTLPVFEWPTLPSFSWPDLPSFSWPELPSFSWPKLPDFKWPTLPKFEWPTLPKFNWPALPSFHWPALPTFQWPAAPSWWPFGGQPAPANQAIGSMSFRGGMATVGEVGPEAVFLPKGTVTVSNREVTRILENNREQRFLDMFKQGDNGTVFNSFANLLAPPQPVFVNVSAPASTGRIAGDGGRGGATSVNIDKLVVQEREDIHKLAFRIADILRRN